MAVRRILLEVEEAGLNPLKPHSRIHKGHLINLEDGESTASTKTAPAVKKAAPARRPAPVKEAAAPEPKPQPVAKKAPSRKKTATKKTVTTTRTSSARSGLKELTDDGSQQGVD